MTRTRSVIVVIPLTHTFKTFSLHRLYKGLSFLLVFLLLGEIKLGLSRRLTSDNESFLVDSLGNVLGLSSLTFYLIFSSKG